MSLLAFIHSVQKGNGKRDKYWSMQQTDPRWIRQGLIVLITVATDPLLHHFELKCYLTFFSMFSFIIYLEFPHKIICICQSLHFYHWSCIFNSRLFLLILLGSYVFVHFPTCFSAFTYCEKNNNFVLASLFIKSVIKKATEEIQIQSLQVNSVHEISH